MEAIESYEEPRKIKVLSVRLPSEEAQYINELARKSGLTCSAFIRMRLKENNVILPVEKIEELILASRQLEQAFERYLDVLEELLRTSQEFRNEEFTLRLMEEIHRAESLINLTFRTQKQAARLIHRMHRKV